MGDIFKEQLVSRTMNQKEKAQAAGIWIVAILGSVVAIVLVGFGIIVAIALLWGASFLTGKLKKEHEYILTNNELDIDVIYNKQTRKNLLTIDIKKIDVMASINDEKHQASLERAQQTVDASDGQNEKDTYGIMISHNGTLKKLLITPNEDLLTLMHKQAPHKVMRYRG